MFFPSQSILVADDNPKVREEYAAYMGFFFGTVYEAGDGEEALALWKEKKPDMLLLDISMPCLNGVEVLRLVRREDRRVPVMILTGHADREYLLELVELNVQRFLQKPVDPAAFREAILFCAESLKPEAEEGVEPLGKQCRFDSRNSRIIGNGGEEIPLTRQELLFLELLLRHKNRIVTYPEIENHVWTHKPMTENALKALVRNLRRKMPEELFHNHKGIGYKIGA